jgi:hypothetical protein
LYCAINTVRLGYKTHSLNAVQGNNRCLLKYIYNKKNAHYENNVFCITERGGI